MHDEMINVSEEFYKSLELPYRVFFLSLNFLFIFHLFQTGYQYSFWSFE